MGAQGPDWTPPFRTRLNLHRMFAQGSERTVTDAGHGRQNQIIFQGGGADLHEGG